MAAITPRLTASSSFVKYVAGVSASARSGYTTASRGIWKEFDFEPVEAGVPGVPDNVLPFDGSELCRSRCESEKRSPKLFRPLVDVEVRPEGVTCGEDWRSTSLALFKELIVEERPLEPSSGGGIGIDGVDFADRWDVIESFRKTDGPGDPKGALVSANVEWVGDGKGDGCSGSDSPRNSGTWIALTGSLTWGGLLPGEVDVRPLLDNLGVLMPSTYESAGGIFTGRGNRCFLSFFRRGKWKKVVVVETVCVVVVSA